MAPGASKEIATNNLTHFLAMYSDPDGRVQSITISAEGIIDAVCLAKYQGGAHPAVGFYKLIAVFEKTRQAQIRAIIQANILHKGNFTNV